MKKSSQETSLLNSDLATNKEDSIEKVVTADINILLNRVRLDKKNNLKKKIILISILLIALSSVTFYAII